ncbi:DUF3179 domain-containing protein [bacterium]|nr:DUF3179 domain-containing protein [bacterium]
MTPTFVQAVAGWLPVSAADPHPAFDVRNCPFLADIYDLAPRPNAIPALENPTFIPAQEAVWLDEREPVLGLKVGDDTRCYPVRIMNYHSLVHDRLSGQAVYVFWDPPSGLALARRQWAASRPLGLAGLGFRGTGLAFDPATGALWDLFGGGPLSAPGRSVTPKLPDDTQWLPLERMTWRAWRRLHGNTQVLSLQTGYAYNYSLDPYAAAVSPQGAPEDYWRSDTILAPAALRVGDELLPDKAMVLGFLSGSEQWAAPVDELATETGAVTIETAAGPVKVTVRPQDDSYSATDAQGRWLPQVRLFWFAWKAHFPETRAWHPAPEED